MQSKFKFSLDYTKNDIHKSIIQNLNVMTVKSIQHIISWQYFHKYTQIKLTFIIKLNPELIKTLNKDVIKMHTKKNLLLWGICFTFSLLIMLLPESEIFTRNFKIFLAITVFGLALAAFELVHEMFIAILMPSLWLFFNVAPASVIFSPWVGSTMMMLTGAFFLAASLEDCGLLRRIAFTLMCKVNGSYFKLLASIMIVGVILNLFCSGMGYLVMAPLAAGLVLSLNGMKTKIGAGIAAAVMLGSCTSHAYTYQTACWGVIMRMGEKYLAPTDITPLSIILHCWPLFFVSLFILFIISKLYKPDNDLTKITYFQEKLNEMGKITRKEKSNMFVMLLLLIYIFTVDIHGLSIDLGFAILPWLVFLPGLNGADNNTIKKMNVTMLFFVAACMSIGTVATSMGFGDAIATVCQTLLSGNNNPTIIMGIVFAIVFLLNFLMTPLAIFALIIEPMCMMALNVGLSPIPFAYAVNACSEALIMPYEYVPYLVVYSFGMLTSKDFIKINIIRTLLFFAGFLLILVPYWKLIGLF